MILKLTFHSKENSKKCHSFNSELSKSAVNTITFPVTQKTASEKHFKPNWSETVITQRFIHEKKKPLQFHYYIANPKMKESKRLKKC